MNFLTQRLWLLAILLLIAMLLPIWIGRYFPSYDYPNHLLEAQIVVHYDDPQLSYADNYDINSGWYLRSNALSTLLLIALGQMIVILTAGIDLSVGSMVKLSVLVGAILMDGESHNLAMAITATLAQSNSCWIATTISTSWR